MQPPKNSKTTTSRKIGKPLMTAEKKELTGEEGNLSQWRRMSSTKLRRWLTQ